jgi:hypothetical protein
MRQDYSGEEEEEERKYREAGPSSAPIKGKGKNKVHRSPFKQSEVTIVLPCMPVKEKVIKELHGCVDRL